MVGKEEFPKFQLFPWQQRVLDNLMKLNKGSHYITLKGFTTRPTQLKPEDSKCPESSR